MLRAVSLSILLVVSACSNRSQRARESAPPPPPQPAHVEFAVPEGTTPGAVVDTASYRIEARPTDDDGYPIGRQGAFTIEVTTKGEATLPRDRPAHVELRSPTGLGVSLPRLERASAPVSTESRILFESTFLPIESGDSPVDAVVHLVVCGASGCEERTDHLRIVLSVHEVP